MSMTMPRDPLRKDSGKFVMVPVGRNQRQCLSKEPDVGFQCQLVKEHKGPHKFWKELPLMGWED